VRDGVDAAESLGEVPRYEVFNHRDRDTRGVGGEVGELLDLYSSVVVTLTNRQIRTHLFALGGGADGAAHVPAFLEELEGDVDGDEAVEAGDEDSGHVGLSWVRIY
jgi:hypothetical protein